MPYNNVISRTDVIETEGQITNEIVQNATEQSVALQLFRRVNMTKSQAKFPVLAALPTAYWVNGDTGLKQTTQMAWTQKYLQVEELAAIVPIPENVVDDSDFDTWAEVRPRLEEAIARALDAAIFFGQNAPSSFPTNVRAAATAAGNVVTAGATAAEGGAYGDLDDLIGVLEDDGYDADAYAFSRRIRSRLRRARNTNGERLDAGRLSAGMDEFDGDPAVYFPRGIAPDAVAGSPGTAGVLAIAGQWDNFVAGVRSDITLKMLDQAVIQDNDGTIIYNLPQQDMLALRVTFRAGWQVANPVVHGQATEAERYPAAVLEYAA